MKSVILSSIAILFSLFQLTESKISSSLSNLENKYKDQKNQASNEDYFTDRVLDDSRVTDFLADNAGYWQGGDHTEGDAVFEKPMTGRIIIIDSESIDFTMSSQFFDSTYSGVVSYTDMCYNDGESACDSDRRVRRVLDGEDADEEMEEEGSGAGGIRIPLVTGYVVIKECDDIDYCLDLDFEDDDFSNSGMGSIQFTKWDFVNDNNIDLWGVYETADDDDYLVINWEGICYQGETMEWLGVDQLCTVETCDSSFEVYALIDEDDIEITQSSSAREEGTLSVDINDETFAYTMLAATERGSYLEGSWSWFADITDDGEILADSGCTSWDAFQDDGITFGSGGDMSVGDQSITFDGEQATNMFYVFEYEGDLKYEVFLYDSTTLYITGQNDNDNVCGAASYVMDVDDSWSCPTDQMGCNRGDLVESTQIGYTGQYYMERSKDVANIVFRREKCSDCELYETVKGERTGGVSSTSFDLIDTAEDNSIVNLCGCNAVFADDEKTHWLFSVGDDCNLIFKPFRGVQQQIQYTYDGTVDEFVAAIVPEFFDALFDAIVAVVEGFKLTQIFLTDCFIASRRLRFRVLDNDIQMEYEITPEETETEDEEDEDSYDDVTASLTLAADAATAAVADGITIEGATEVEGSFSSVEVVVEYGDDPFAETTVESSEDTVEPSSADEDDTDEDDDVSAINMSFPTIIMTTLLVFIGLFGM